MSPTSRVWRFGVVGAVIVTAACQTVGGAVSIDDGGPGDAGVDSSVPVDATVQDVATIADVGTGADTSVTIDASFDGTTYDATDADLDASQDAAAE